MQGIRKPVLVSGSGKQTAAEQINHEQNPRGQNPGGHQEGEQHDQPVAEPVELAADHARHLRNRADLRPQHRPHAPGLHHHHRRQC